MSKVIKVVVGDRIRLRSKFIPQQVIKKRYIVELYDEPTCDKCDNLPDRHNDLCDECPAFTGRYKFFSQKELEQRKLWSLPQGDELWVEDYVYKVADKHDYDVAWVDKRPDCPFDNDIQFTGKLYGPKDKNEDGTPKANQKKVVEKWLAAGTGVIRARPRTGKTVMATYIYTEVGQKTVVLAHQKDLLRQFYETATGYTPPKFRGNKRIADGEPARKRKAVTNIKQIQDDTGKEVIRLIDKFSQLEKADEHYDIILMTYQSLMKDPERILKYINGRYSLICVDEQHQGSANGYLRVLATLNVRHRLSLSATTDRKDNRHLFGRLVLGPVVASSGAHALIPSISFIKTGFKCDLKSWAGVDRRKNNDKDRLHFLVKQVFKDLRAGHNSIIIPVRSRHLQAMLVAKINKQADMNARKRGEDWPIELARAFHGQSDREAVLDWVDDPEWDTDPPKGVKRPKGKPAPRVLVGIEKMVKQGIDFASPTMLYVVEPMSAKGKVGAPMFDQMSNRVCTPVPGKRKPHVRIFVDDVNMFKGALTGLFWKEIFPKSNIKHKADKAKIRYHMSDKDYAHAKAALAKEEKKSSNWNFNKGW